ncbi:EKC/KEOPS complex subunit TP53RK [Glycine soja]
MVTEWARVFYRVANPTRGKAEQHSKQNGAPHDHRSSPAKTRFSPLANSDRAQKIVNSYDLTRQIAILTSMNTRDSSLVLLKQGAEARVFESSFVGRKSVVKERFSKKYRHPTLDSKLTLKRLNMEARCMTKARRLGVWTPVLYAVDPVLHTLTFEYVEGTSVKDVFLEFGSHGVNKERLDDIAFQIGDTIGKLHDGGLIHGDLTTSNMLLKSDTKQLVLIDFGLSFTSTLPEDKAVDLYVLERALISMHSSCGNVMDQILAAYRKSSKQWSSTLNKLAQVRQRGRKRTMVG